MSNNTRHTPGPWVWNEWTWLDGADGKPVLEYAGCGSHECEVNEANARLIAAAPALVEALKALLARDMRNTCQHENTHRGGVIWEICDDCGAKWADDEGGKPEWKDPKEWDAAFAALRAAGVATDGGLGGSL